MDGQTGFTADRQTSLSVCPTKIVWRVVIQNARTFVWLAQEFHFAIEIEEGQFAFALRSTSWDGRKPDLSHKAILNIVLGADPELAWTLHMAGTTLDGNPVANREGNFT